MFDGHSHSLYSHDGKTTLYRMIKKAERLNLEYYAITEHLDADYRYGKWERLCRKLNLDKYRNGFSRLSKKLSGKTYFAFGVEFGYNRNLENFYKAVAEKYNFDVIINSIHTLDGIEAYFGGIFKGKSQEEVYNRYLDALIMSVDAEYDYNVVGHIGYITRYANYENNSLFQPQYMTKIDLLLNKIIAKNKTIEINTRVGGQGIEFLPETDILLRYKELGGRNVTYGSDAHRAKELAYNYAYASEIAKKVGFDRWTVYKKGIPHHIPIL